MPETNKKPAKPTQAPKQTPAPASGPKSAPTIETKTETKPVAKTLPKLDDAVRVRVRSNRYGKLGFTNSHTGDKYYWADIDDVQDLTVGDIRNMRGQANSFFTQTWVIIEEIESPECEGLTDEQTYDALGLRRYYEDCKKSHYVKSARKWNASQIKKRVPEMNQNLKANIAAALNTSIKNGLLNDLSLIKTWETALGIELDLSR